MFGSHSYQCYDLVSTRDSKVLICICVCVCVCLSSLGVVCVSMCVCMCLFVCVGMNVCLQCELLVLMREMWKMGCVGRMLHEIVPIPKKGHLKNCDNWRGISLLDMVGKLFGHIL